MSKRSGSFGLGTGGASILVIFVLLCLTTFATLSIVSANADYKLTQRNAQAVQEYYAADLLAGERLAQIDAVLAGPAPFEEGTPAERFHNRLLEQGYENVTVQETPAGVRLSYAVPMSNTRELQVALLVAEDDSWSIEAWQTVTTEEWVEDNSIELWDGGAALTEGADAPPEGVPPGLASLPV